MSLNTKLLSNLPTPSEMIDIELGLLRVAQGFQGVYGIGATVLGVLYAILTAALALAIIAFDLIPTAQFSLTQSAYLLPESMAGLGMILGLLLTLVPSLLEVLGPVLMKRQIQLAWVPVLVVTAFDALSDLPSCQVFVHSFASLYAMTPAPILVERVVLVAWLFCATIGFELLAITTFVTSLVLLRQGRM